MDSPVLVQPDNVDNSAPYGPQEKVVFHGCTQMRVSGGWGLNPNGLQEFYSPNLSSSIKKTLKKRRGEKLYSEDINRWLHAGCAAQFRVRSVIIWTVACFLLFWLPSSTLDFKRNNGLKVLTLSFMGVCGC